MNSESKEAIFQMLSPLLRQSPIEAYGWRVLPMPLVQDPLAQLERIRNFHIRDDDVLIAAYPKSGTHWTWEVTHMLLKQTTEYEKRTKEQVMLEAPGALERSEEEPSPRILNSHCVFPHLPQEIISKKTKIIHVVRNPKDTLVSFYCQLKTMLNDPHFTFELLIDAVINDLLIYPTQLDYLHQMTEFESLHPDHPIKHVCYEEMKKDPVHTIKELSQFLNVSASDDFCRQVADACSFQKMKVLEETEAKIIPPGIQDHFKSIGQNLIFYRKGIIGDWKNYFTVALNQRFDEYIETYRNTKGIKFNFIYE